jgi:hypothetical protein
MAFQIIIWSCVTLFVLTSFITLLALVGVIKLGDYYLKNLFKALVLEVVAAGVAAFSVYIKHEVFVEPKQVPQEIANIKTDGTKDQTIANLVHTLELRDAVLTVCSQNLAAQAGKLESCNAELLAAPRLSTTSKTAASASQNFVSTPCPSEQDTRCIGTLSVPAGGNSLPTCKEVIAFTQPADVRLGKVNWIRIVADGKEFQCNQALTSGQSCKFDFRGGKWIAILGAVGEQAANVDFRRTCS